MHLSYNKNLSFLMGVVVVYLFFCTELFRGVPCGRCTPARVRFITSLFIVYMNWIDKCSQADKCATIGNCKISRLLFADDLVLLSSTESGLQCALNSFADSYNIAGMKISTAKTDVLHLSRNPDQCVLQVNGASLKQVREVQVPWGCIYE